MSAAWLTPRAVADLLDISRDTVLRAVKRGSLGAFQDGRIIRISPADLDRFIASHSTRTPPRHRGEGPAA